MTHYSMKFFYSESKTTKTNAPGIYMLYTKTNKRLKLTVGRSSSRVSRHGHSETESESTELSLYISMADSVKFR